MSAILDCTHDFLVEDDAGQHTDRNKRNRNDVEADAHRIAQRQKQVDYGKNTIGYQRYITSVPRQERQRREPRHPETPDIHMKCSKRGFDAMIKQWRRQLHAWDLDEGEEAHKFVNNELRSPRSVGKGTLAASTPSDQDTADRFAVQGAHKSLGIGEQSEMSSERTSPGRARSKEGNANRGRKRGLQEVQEAGGSGGQARKGWAPSKSTTWADAMDETDSKSGAGDLFDDWEDDIQM